MKEHCSEGWHLRPQLLRRSHQRCSAERARHLAHRERTGPSPKWFRYVEMSSARVGHHSKSGARAFFAFPSKPSPWQTLSRKYGTFVLSPHTKFASISRYLLCSASCSDSPASPNQATSHHPRTLNVAPCGFQKQCMYMSIGFPQSKNHAVHFGHALFTFLVAGAGDVSDTSGFALFSRLFLPSASGASSRFS